MQMSLNEKTFLGEIKEMHIKLSKLSANLISRNLLIKVFLILVSYLS